jgi:hypothetical protein
MRWTTTDDGVVVDERRASSTWWTISPADLERESAAAGLTCTAADAELGLYVLSTAPPYRRSRRA